MNLVDLGLASAREGGVTFKTGRPVTFRYVHNNEPAPKLGARFGQDIEPAGFYVQHVPGDSPPPRGWSSGTMVLERPLVLVESFDKDSVYGPTGWKARLHAETKKRRLALSRYLMAAGFDAVVAVRGKDTTEIVVLRATPRR
jgi:hypothetical protein